MPGPTTLSDFLTDTFEEPTLEAIRRELEEARAKAMEEAFKSPLEFDEGEG